MDKPSLPKGTRDFGPAQMAKRQLILDTVRDVFRKYGFMPLETPAMENLSTLSGKYGEEGDQLLFRILNSGDYLKAFREQFLNSVELSRIRSYFRELLDLINERLGQEKHRTLTDYKEFVLDAYLPAYERTSVRPATRDIVATYVSRNLDEIAEKVQAWFAVQPEDKTPIQIGITHFSERNLIAGQLELSLSDFCTQAIGELRAPLLNPLFSDKGLRYDLTVPFARYVVMNRHEIALPFKRYQVQPVWRADRPQKGRYREFFQCDADVVGTDSLICEAEIVLMIKEAFSGLRISGYSVKINHRGILSGLAEATGSQNESALFVAIDKLDKIGEEKVREELASKGFSNDALQTVFSVLNFNGTSAQKLDFLRQQFKNSEKGQKGIKDIEELLTLLNSYGSDESHVEFDVSLARGLSYYTGCIFEVKVHDVAIGSVSGGGRYDNLTQAFGSKERLSGVGISFGIDRIYDAMEELKLFPPEATRNTTVLICHLDKSSLTHGLGVLAALRAKGISSEVYPDEKKIDKQLDYANNKKIPFAIIIGPDELKVGRYGLKDLRTGTQEKLELKGIIEHVSRK